MTAGVTMRLISALPSSGDGWSGLSGGKRHARGL
jgi:hypothetical protein